MFKGNLCVLVQIEASCHGVADEKFNLMGEVENSERRHLN
jgi:hypothetical protein